jgi:glycosyltransferase involved in cell wall biosynthesis
MNIAFLFYCPIVPHIGGVQRVTDVLAKEFERRGHNVIFICTESQNRDDVYPYYSAKQIYLDSNKNDEEFTADYCKILQTNDINVVISQEARSDSLLLLENTPICVKRISVVHINPYAIIRNEQRIKRAIRSRRLVTNLAKYLVMFFPHIARQYYRFKENKFYRRILGVSDKLVFLSPSFVELLKENIPDISSRKLAAIGNPNTFVPKHEVGTKENLIICVARLSEVQKNVRDFILVWQQLYKDNPKWKAIIVGDGPDRGMLESFAKKKGVRNLSFVGRVENVGNYYQRAKFVCMTSIYEGWGMVLTEGMSYGCVPCVYGSYGAAFDIVDDGVNGIISTPFRPKEMADRIQTLINDESRLVQMSSSAIEKVKDFNADKVADKWDALFGSLEE